MTAAFIFSSSLVLFVSYWLRRRFSGKNFTGVHFLLCVACNFPFGIFHLEIIANSCIKFIGCFPNLHFDYPVLSWFAFACVFLHCFAFPVESEPRWILRKKPKF